MHFAGGSGVPALARLESKAIVVDADRRLAVNELEQLLAGHGKRQPWVSRLLFGFRIRLSISLRSASVASAISLSSAISGKGHQAIAERLLLLAQHLLVVTRPFSDRPPPRATMFTRSAPWRDRLVRLGDTASWSRSPASARNLDDGIVLGDPAPRPILTLRQRSRQRRATRDLQPFTLQFCTPFSRFHSCDWSTSYFAGSESPQIPLTSRAALRRRPCSCRKLRR